MTSPISTTTARRTWSATVADLLQMRRSSEDQTLRASIELVEAAAPAHRLASADHVARAKRVTAASIIAKLRAESAPADDPAKLRVLLAKHPARFTLALAGIHRLRERAGDLSYGWSLSPPISDLVVLKNMANEDVDQVHIRAELASVNYNPISALAVAYLDLAEQRPELFGDLDLAEESKQTLERVVDEGRNAG